MASDPQPFASRAELDRCLDHARTLRARALVSREAWACVGSMLAAAFAPLLGRLRRGRAAVGQQPIAQAAMQPGGPPAAA